MNWALALLSSALLIAIHPGPDIPWLAWIALTPLLVAIGPSPQLPSGGGPPGPRGVPRPRPGFQRLLTWFSAEPGQGGAGLQPGPLLRFFLGFTTGCAYWFVHCNWIQFVLEVHGGMGFWGGWGCFFLFCFYKALHLGVFAALAGLLSGRWWSAPALAALWVGIERTHGTFAFAWLTLGNAGVNIAPWIAPWVGVYGISFLFALVAAGFATRRFYWCAPLVLALVPAPATGPPPTASAAVIQPNIDEQAEWTTETAGASQRRLLGESLELALRSKSRLIIWPEAPAPIFLDDSEFMRHAADLARTAQAYFLFGGVGYTAERAPLNSAALISPAGDRAGQYDKMYLVPFGEFIPPLFGFVNKITKEAGNYHPGDRVVVFPVDGHKLGTFICYESAFPHLVRQFALAGADAFINLSNDGYFGRSYAREQHLKLVRMRAIENHRWIVRPTNDGITAVVDPLGRVTERLEPYKPLAASLRFGYEKDVTFYTRHGDWFAWGCLLLAAVIALSNFSSSIPAPTYKRSLRKS